ncbi:metalloendopeptidase [Aureococcus anophagefferens]|nr:metalloendopeptidase [Aureococcus anophagefferens]
MALLLGALLAAVATAANLRAPPPSLLDTLKSYTRVDVAHADGAALGADESFRDAVRLRISGAGIDVVLDLERDSSAFHANYKELALDGAGGVVVARAGRRGCGSSAAAASARAGVRPRDGVPRASRARGGVDGRHYAPGAGGHDHGEGREGDDHGEGREGHDHGEAHDHDDHDDRGEAHDHGDRDEAHDRRGDRARRLAAGECDDGATKYLGVVVFNDESRYATRGVDVEAHSAAVLDVVHSIYGDEAPFGLYDGATVKCRVVPVVVGQMTWRDGDPAEVDYAAGDARRLGHNFGMEHDAVGDDGAPAYLMSASTPQAPSGTNLQFSAASRSSAAAYFEDTYGVGPVDACLDDAEAPSWDAAICGDGIVDAGEACDVGLFIEDACCRDDCSLEPAACAAADACCDGGLFAAAGTVCRAAVDDACDDEETCTGASGDCPTDLYRSAGTACDDAAGGDFDGGRGRRPVLRGRLRVLEDSCVDLEMDDEPACINRGLAVRDGTPCGDGGACFAVGYEAGFALTVDDGAGDGDGDGGGASDLCVDPSTLATYHWDTGADGCAAPSCRTEEGAAAGDERCDDDPGLPALLPPTGTPAPTARRALARAQSAADAGALGLPRADGVLRRGPGPPPGAGAPGAAPVRARGRRGAAPPPRRSAAAPPSRRQPQIDVRRSTRQPRAPPPAAPPSTIGATIDAYDRNARGPDFGPR